MTDLPGSETSTLGGAAGAAAPSALIHGGTGGARSALYTEFFPSLLSSEGAFSGISDSLVESFSGGKPPDPQVAVDSLGDYHTKHCASGKEFKRLKSTPVEEYTYT